MYLIFVEDIGGIGHRPKTDPSGNEMVVQDVQSEDDAQTKFYTQHMKRHLPPTMADRPSTRSFDANLGKQVSESFREQTFAYEDHYQKDAEMDTNYGKTLAILAGTLFILTIVVAIIRHNDEKQFEKIVKKNKEAKSG